MIFRELRLSLGHFGQQVPESPGSQLQSGVSRAPLPPFIVDLLIKVKFIFSMGTLEGFKWLISQADYNGPKQIKFLYHVTDFLLLRQLKTMFSKYRMV